MDNRFFDFIIDCVIVYYCICYTLNKGGSYNYLDKACISIFITEYILRFLAHGLFIEKTGLFRDNFHIYDIIILTLAFIYTFLLPEYSHYNLLIFRFLRIIKLMPFKHLILLFEGIFSCVLELSQIYLFFLIFSTVFSFIGMILFSGLLQNYCTNPKTGLVSNWYEVCGEYDPCNYGEICLKSLSNIENDVTNFNDFLNAFLQVIRIITFDNWSTLLKQIRSSWYLGAYFYFIPLAIFGNFLVINMFLAVLKSEFETFKKRKNIKQEHKASLSIGVKMSFVARGSSFLKKNMNLRSLIQKNIGNRSLSKLNIGKFSSVTKINQSKLACIEGFMIEKEANSSTYRRFLMKMLHFEKYSQKFYTYFDRILEFLNDFWEYFLIENIIKFPISNVLLNPAVNSIQFYSIDDIFPDKKTKEESNFIKKIESLKKYAHLEFDIRQYFKYAKNNIETLKIKKNIKIPLKKKKKVIFEKKSNKEANFPTIQKKKHAKKGQKLSLKENGEKFDVKNYEDMKYIINENYLKGLKDKKNDNFSFKLQYYEILVLFYSFSLK